MTNDALSDLWNSTPNRPAAEAGDHLASEFVARLRHRRRLQAWWLAWTFVALTGTTSLVVIQLVRQGSAGVAGQSALWPMLALPWLAAFIFLRRFRRERKTPGSSIPPLHVALVAARASNEAECRRLFGVGTLLLVMTPVTALAIWQLHLAGKATASQAWSMALVFGAALTLGGGLATWRYRRHLVPERSRIDALLRDLDAFDAR
jgi:hypothetical protein